MKKLVFMVNNGSDGWSVAAEYDTAEEALADYLNQVGASYGSQHALFYNVEITLTAPIHDGFQPFSRP